MEQAARAVCLVLAVLAGIAAARPPPGASRVAAPGRALHQDQSAPAGAPTASPPVPSEGATVAIAGPNAAQMFADALANQSVSEVRAPAARLDAHAPPAGACPAPSSCQLAAKLGSGHAHLATGIVACPIAPARCRRNCSLLARWRLHSWHAAAGTRGQQQLSSFVLHIHMHSACTPATARAIARPCPSDRRRPRARARHAPRALPRPRTQRHAADRPQRHRAQRRRRAAGHGGLGHDGRDGAAQGGAAAGIQGPWCHKHQVGARCQSVRELAAFARAPVARRGSRPERPPSRRARP